MEMAWEEIPRYYNMSALMTETWNLPKEEFFKFVSEKVKITLMSKNPPYVKIDEISKDFFDFTGFPPRETAMRFNFTTFESFLKSRMMEDHVCISMNLAGQHEFTAKVQNSNKLQHITDNVQESYENKVKKEMKHNREKYARAMLPENRGPLLEGRKLLCRLVHELNGSEKVPVPVQAVIHQYALENNGVALNEQERRKYFKRGNISKIIEDYCSDELEIIVYGGGTEKYLKLRMPYNEICAMHDSILAAQQNMPSTSNGTGMYRQSRMDLEFQEVRGRWSPSLSRNQNTFVCPNKYCIEQYRTKEELREHQLRCCGASSSSNLNPRDAEPGRQVSQKNRKVASPYYKDENAELWNASNGNSSSSSMPPEDPIPIPWNVMNNDLHDRYIKNDNHSYQKPFSTLQGNREISSSTACIPQPSRFTRRPSSRDSSDSDGDGVMNILENENQPQQNKQDNFSGTKAKLARENELVYSPNRTAYVSDLLELPNHPGDNIFDVTQPADVFNEAEFAQKLGLSITDLSNMESNWNLMDIDAFQSNSVAGASSSAVKKRRKPPMPIRIQRLSQLITSVMTYRGRDSMELRIMSELLESVDPEYSEVLQGNLDCLGNLDIFMEKYCPSVTVSIIRDKVYVSLHKIKE
ncbi:hypothetical protein DdX_15936 [Ditylenchus destructor]|uniref:Uncharacterized protein n=1 Tax=Ditylenchus destructor TaxID=166010 RepID=A0AAD4MRV3_9BILA|nr:hypothetical protein DdX_15936 [Ditylenchus destructor]